MKLLCPGIAILYGLATSFQSVQAIANVAPIFQSRSIDYVVKPKVFIISMFQSEAEAWYGIPDFDLLARNITVPGFSPLFPDAHCTTDGDICQLTTGESGMSKPNQYRDGYPH